MLNRFAALALALAVCLITACKKNAATELKVTNGVEIEANEFPAVVRLTIRLAKGAALCTGTFISPTTILTASHCVNGATAIEAVGKRADRFLPNPKWDTNSRPTFGWDTAVVLFKDPVSSDFLPLATDYPNTGDLATIVGFGFTDWDTKNDSGTKRKGTTKILTLANVGQSKMLQTEGASGNSGAALGSDSAVGQGDSGGPLILNGRIIGVASLGGGGQAGRATSLHAPVMFEGNKEWIATFLAIRPQTATGFATSTATSTAPFQQGNVGKDLLDSLQEADTYSGNSTATATSTGFYPLPNAQAFDSPSQGTGSGVASGACSCGIDPNANGMCAIYLNGTRVANGPSDGTTGDCERACDRTFGRFRDILATQCP